MYESAVFQIIISQIYSLHIDGDDTVTYTAVHLLRSLTTHITDAKNKLCDIFRCHPGPSPPLSLSPILKKLLHLPTFITLQECISTSILKLAVFHICNTSCPRHVTCLNVDEREKLNHCDALLFSSSLKLILLKGISYYKGIAKECSEVTGVTLFDLPQLYEVRTLSKAQSILSDPCHPLSK